MKIIIITENKEEENEGVRIENQKEYVFYFNTNQLS